MFLVLVGCLLVPQGSFRLLLSSLMSVGHSAGTLVAPGVLSLSLKLQEAPASLLDSNRYFQISGLTGITVLHYEIF